MSTTVDGIISGLETTSIIEALVSSIKAPADVIQDRVDTSTSKLSAIQSLSAAVLSVQVAAQALGSSDVFNANSVSSSNSTIVQASATTDAEEGSYTISVQQLATAMQVSSSETNTFSSQSTELGLEGDILVNGEVVSLKSTDTLTDVAARINNAGAGVNASVVQVKEGEFRLSITSSNMGEEGLTLANAGSANILESLYLKTNGTDTIKNSITNGAASDALSSKTGVVSTLMGLESTPPSGTVTIANGTGSISVDIDLSTDSLDDIATAINSAATAAGSSISASVVQNSDGNYQLEITSGDATTPTFTDSNNVLETLGVVTSSFTQVDQEGNDAEFTVNGLSITRSSNTITNVIEGVTLSLRTADNPDTNVTITVSSDRSEATDALENFVDAYNSVITYMDTVASYNSESGEAGILLGDSSLRNVQSALSGLLTSSVSTLASQQLTDLNNGEGVANGSIQIKDSSGKTATIDLSSAETVQDVLDAINYATDIDVTASVNRAGTGLVITDAKGGLITISEVGGGTTASDLGILGSSSSGRIGGTAIGTGELLSLAQLGITVNEDGSLAFDTEEFEDYYAENANAVKAFFSQDGGFADQAESALNLLTDDVNGSLTTRATSLEDTITSYEESIDRINERAELAQTRLETQFAAMEATLSELQTQSDYLESQITQWESLYNSDN